MGAPAAAAGTRVCGSGATVQEPRCDERASAGASGSRPLVSVMIPCHNEEGFIGACLDSIVSNDYRTERFEVLVVDGMSEDGTRHAVDECARRYSYVGVLDNPRREQQIALDLAAMAVRDIEGLDPDAKERLEGCFFDTQTIP